MRDWREELRTMIAAGEVRFDEPMRAHTSFRIGGPVDALVVPGTPAELRQAADFAVLRELPWLVLGRGSNLLVRDGGLRGLALKTSPCLRWCRFTDGEVLAGAGLTLAELANEAAARSLAGLAFAGGIPGTVGGGVLMNAGAYGGEMAAVVTEVTAYYPGRGEKVWSGGELGFGYRQSRFQGETVLIENARFKLTAGDEAAIREEMACLARQRQAKQPLSMPSAGSVFRRPPGGHAGPLIEQAGLKGVCIGAAQVSPLHANFIVNLGGATAADVLALIELVQRRVLASSGVMLVPEIKVVGED
ncbi:MAG: UDP-N-acetylmuramate dehydrogenase [Bacteroidota bacterium]